MEDKFLKDYFSKLKSLINFDEDTIQKLLNVLNVRGWLILEKK